MPSALMHKERGSLWPADDRAEATLARVKDSTLIWVTWKRRKNARQLGLYFKLLAVVFDHLPERLGNHYPTAEVFRKSLEVEAGFAEPLHTPDGDLVGFAPKSIADAGQDEFNEAFNAVVDRLYQVILPAIGSPELEQACDTMLADKRYEETRQ